ncbi:MAG: biopolymer transporter ExbD [Chromatiales bacterium]|nr:biopolymer transporter ExbD [Gammaproteobacteria bacterium]MBW6477230.1 biopolymer transporter ExbD [Chromatiales bacterium]
MRLQSRRAEDPDLNLTPLIDVVFLLLIFFMVSTTFERDTEISLELPEASGEPLKTEQVVIEISIDAQGHYYVNQQELINTQIDTIKRAIQQARGDVERPQVILSADRQTPHQAVITAMDAARQVGLVNLTFATSSPAEAR